MRDVIKRKHKFLKAAVKVTIPVFCLFVGVILYTSSIQEFVENPLDVKQWHHNVLAEADPGAGASGVLRQYIVANGVFTYTSNITVNASVYAAGETNNSHINSTVPYGASYPHDIVWKVRWNTTHAYNSTGSVWELGWVRGNITSPYHSLTDQGMDEYHIVNNSNFMWVHYVWDGTLGVGGSGETIARGANSTINRIECDAYY